MPKEMRPPRYLPKDAKAGMVMAKMAEYVGESEGTYGKQFNFMELESGQHVVLSGGVFKWRIEQGHIVEGEVFDIIFEGKKKMEKGQFAGKDVNDFKILKYEDAELPEAFLAKRGKIAGAAAAAGGAGSAPAPRATQSIPTPEVTAESEALDDLA